MENRAQVFVSTSLDDDASKEWKGGRGGYVDVIINRDDNELRARLSIIYCVNARTVYHARLLLRLLPLVFIDE